MNSTVTKFDESEILRQFPIVAQNTIGDKKALLGLRSLFSAQKKYRYVEIGSFMGGSLTPFLSDAKCEVVLSIDKRKQVFYDERGQNIDYTLISEAAMVENLKAHNVPIEKLECFDGDVASVAMPKHKFDFLFIDGEHTDTACFSDFLHGRKLLSQNAIIAFHDTTLIQGAIKLILVLLASENAKFRFEVVEGSDVSFILLGKMCEADLTGLNIIADKEMFFEHSGNWLLISRAKQRLKPKLTISGIDYSVIPPKTLKQGLDGSVVKY